LSRGRPDFAGGMFGSYEPEQRRIVRTRYRPNRAVAPLAAGQEGGESPGLVSGDMPMVFTHPSRLAATVAALLLALFPGSRQAAACPFCSASQMTLSEELKTNDAAVIIKLVHRPPEQSADAPIEASQCTFEVVEALKGEEHLARQPGAKKPYQIKILYFGDQALGTTFLAYGIDPANLAWGTPTVLGKPALDYVRKLPKLPDAGAERLTFFQNFFESEDPLLASDAYDEFAKAPYSDLVAIKEKMHREKLIKWIGDKNVSTSRRRLYLCMLSVCGTQEDIAFLEKMIRSEDRQTRTALDAMIGSYLTLKGPTGMPLVEDLFLKNAAAEYTDTYSAIMALRFIGTETSSIPRARLMEGLRHMLSRPKLADLVISDLTRWQDWSAMPRLVELFKTSDEQSSWVRVPVINYLRACPLPEAKTHLEELAKLDPEAVKRASFYVPQAAVPPEGAQRPAGETTGAPAATPAAVPPAGASAVPPPNSGSTLFPSWRATFCSVRICLDKVRAGNAVAVK
jgi:hypothetical protein